MARPPRNSVDYFPFICEDGNKMFYIEETYGNDGFATFVKILRELAKTNFHYLDLSKPTTQMFLSAKCKISKEILLAIINDLVELGKFDKVLWRENQIVWCQDFIDSIQDAYSKRNNKCITYDGLETLLTSLGVRKPSKCKTKGDGNPQSIVEDTKLDKNKEEEEKPKISFSSPILESYERILLYFDEELRPTTDKQKENWLKTIDQLVRIDGETLENIEAVTRLTREDQFWRDNFQSLTKLRKKDKQDLQYFKRFKNQLKNKHNDRPKATGGVTPDKLREIIERHHGNGG